MYYVPLYQIWFLRRPGTTIVQINHVELYWVTVKKHFDIESGVRKVVGRVLKH